MGGAFSAFLITLLLVAIFTRDSYAFILLYLFAGAFIFSHWWSSRVVASLTFERKMIKRAFPGEQIDVELKITNHSRLPIVWLQTQELLPLEISHWKILRKVFSLPPKGHASLSYSLSPTRRGYYPVGPAQATTGDVLGLVREKTAQSECDYLTVYPKVIALSRPPIPSHSPLSSLPYRQPIFEDSSRPVGKRAYSPGDSLRRIDWKSSATTGQLQTKIFEPSISVETVIFLNLNLQEYHSKFFYTSSELAVVVAASLANWIIERKQTTGLVVNGADPFSADLIPQSFPPRKGRAHLMRLLELLARVELAETNPLEEVVRRHRSQLRWGTTILLVTGQADLSLFQEIFQCRRSGLNVLLILCGETPQLQETKARAQQFHISFQHLRDEKDLDRWRT